jgi:GTP-binding protein
MPQSLTSIRFLTSAAALRDLPRDDRPEVAFAGRSNAGKSSALNALAGRHGLARISKTPGRTRLINFFEVEGGGRLADLPGYGFARVPEKMRARWRHLIEGYLSGRRGLRGVVLLMDVRHPLTDFDRKMLDWTDHLGLQCHIALTKADKLGRGAAKRQLLKVRRELEARALKPELQLFSATAPLGVEAVRACVTAWLGQKKPR